MKIFGIIHTQSQYVKSKIYVKTHHHSNVINRASMYGLFTQLKKTHEDTPGKFPSQLLLTS